MRLLTAIALVGLVNYSQAMTLEETVADSIANNPQFRAEVKRYHSYEAEIRGAKSGFRPKIDLHAGIGYEEVDNQNIDNFSEGLTRKESSITLTQNLFNGFGDQNEIKRQQFRTDAQGYTALAKANDVALSMSQAFIDMLKEQELRQLAADNMRTHRQILEQIVERNNAGIGNQVEVDQARARLALAESNYAAAGNNYYDAQARFRRMLGRDPDNQLVKPVFQYPLPVTLERATEIALIEHPTAKTANKDIEETHAQYEAADRFHFPRVDLEIKRSFDQNLNGIEGNSDVFQAMIHVRYNLYNGGRDSADIDRTIHEYQEAYEVRDNTRREIIENLRYAWNARTYVEKQLSFIEQHIKLTYDTLTGYRNQFTLGRRTLLDLLNTENEYYSATKNLINSEAELLKAQYRVLAGMGQLLPALNIDYDFIATNAGDDEQGED